MSSGDSGLARARCGPFTGSCGRTRALRATWRESVARVTLRWSAEPARLPKNRLEGRVARARARDATRSRAPGRAKSRNPLDARGGLTHRHARTSRVRGASRGRGDRDAGGGCDTGDGRHLDRSSTRSCCALRCGRRERIALTESSVPACPADFLLKPTDFWQEAGVLLGRVASGDGYFCRHRTPHIPSPCVTCTWA